MKKVLVLLLLFSCSSGSPYDPKRYASEEEQKTLLSKIIAHIFAPPPYVSAADRLRPEHLDYYRSIAFRFELDQLYVDGAGRHYFLVMRPGNKEDERRAVGGSFMLGTEGQLEHFREVFVTPLMPVSDVRTRSRFLFDEMARGTVGEYLKMPSYVQWPNDASYYDSVGYEWRLRPELAVPDTTAVKVN